MFMIAKVVILVSCMVTSVRTMLLSDNVPRLQQVSKKRGIAYNAACLVDALVNKKADMVSWTYNWDSKANNEMLLDLEYVPMLWGKKDFSGWRTAVEKALSGGSSHILGFNEPDLMSQANMSYSDAAKYYKEFITPYAARAQLISPAVSSSTIKGLGLDWFECFIRDCKDCSISGLAVHWYGNSVDELKSFVSDVISTASAHGISEIWLTEFALISDTNGVSDETKTAKFLNEVLPWLDSQPEITRYAYFYCANGYLVTNDAENLIGEIYISSSS
ncbi:uncharacterized protein N7498_007882 [Penicillium cinerascens]|uniref:Asl1-like glycosyl hydrolase catalytic domain-containing protein n=1 Tax=Penicillium cinerascens TaxID=70096 RepID=A0A9W9JPU3_9EURO|nr:uncharacterized protein N7498_007882 [Penicillium cinerascens]KAJ5198765.1 hypothetical protein N7498_007882 [Penicillium cinerascens]